jgi:hypothetical protein
MEIVYQNASTSDQTRQADLYVLYYEKLSYRINFSFTQSLRRSSLMTITRGTPASI